MKNKIIILITIIYITLTSCHFGTKECMARLQFNNNTVYSVDAFNYIVIEDSVVYHYIPDERWCEGGTYTRIIIK